MTRTRSDWPTKAQDIAIAKEILLDHCNANDETTELNYKEVSFSEDGIVTERHPDWVVDLRDAFESRYGKTKGWQITNKVITQLIVDDQTIH